LNVTYSGLVALVRYKTMGHTVEFRTATVILQTFMLSLLFSKYNGRW